MDSILHGHCRYMYTSVYVYIYVYIYYIFVIIYVYLYSFVCIICTANCQSVSFMFFFKYQHKPIKKHMTYESLVSTLLGPLLTTPGSVIRKAPKTGSSYRHGGAVYGRCHLPLHLKHQYYLVYIYIKDMVPFQHVHNS